MDGLSYLHEVRARYVSGFLKKRDEYRAADPGWTAEVWLQPRTGDDQSRDPICVDLIRKRDDGKIDVTEFAGDELLEGSLIATFDVGQAQVKVYPLSWEICPVWCNLKSRLDVTALDVWRTRWMNPDAKSDSEAGVSRSVHCMSRPAQEGGGYVQEIDFGTAPVDGLIELVAVLAEHGATEIELGRSDGSDIGPEWVARLQHPDLTVSDVTEMVALSFRSLPEVKTATITSTDTIVITAHGSSSTFNLFTGNLYQVLLRAGTEARLREFWNFIRGQRGVFQPEDPPELSDLCVVLKDDRFFNELTDNGKRTASWVTRRFLADLWLCCVWDRPRSISFVQDDEPARYELSADEFIARAVQNTCKNHKDVDLAEEGPLLIARTGDAFCSALLFNAGYWNSITDRIRGELLVCVPARDVVLITGSQTPNGVEEMKKAAARVTAGGNHLISETILKRVGGQWSLFKLDPHAASMPTESAAVANASAKRAWWKLW